MTNAAGALGSRSRGSWGRFDPFAAIGRLLRLGRTRIEGESIEIVLRGNRPLRLSYARNVRLRCTSGCAWITVAGGADDLFLFAGESLRIPTDGLVLAESVGEASVAIEPGQAGALTFPGLSAINVQPRLPLPGPSRREFPAPRMPRAPALRSCSNP